MPIDTCYNLTYELIGWKNDVVSLIRIDTDIQYGKPNPQFQKGRNNSDPHEVLDTDFLNEHRSCCLTVVFTLCLTFHVKFYLLHLNVFYRILLQSNPTCNLKQKN